MVMAVAFHCQPLPTIAKADWSNKGVNHKSSHGRGDWFQADVSSVSPYVSFCVCLSPSQITIGGRRLATRPSCTGSH